MASGYEAKPLCRSPLVQEIVQSKLLSSPGLLTKPDHLNLPSRSCRGDDRREARIINDEVLELKPTGGQIDLFRPILEIPDDVLAELCRRPLRPEHELIGAGAPPVN